MSKRGTGGWSLVVGTSAIRYLILVAALVVGALVIRGAFPSNADRGLAPQGPSPHPVTSRSNRQPSGSPSPKPVIHGVVVQVLNGTSTLFLATSTSTTLHTVGYSVKTPMNAPLTAKTVVYYRPDSQVNAAYLRQRFFPGALLQAAPAR